MGAILYLSTLIMSLPLADHELEALLLNLRASSSFSLCSEDLQFHIDSISFSFAFHAEILGSELASLSPPFRKNFQNRVLHRQRGPARSDGMH